MTDIIVDESPTDRVVQIGGRWLRDVNFIVSKERFRKWWDGYECLACHEPLKESFPVVCPLRGCGYRIRENQRKDLESEYAGVNEEFNALMRDDETVEERATRSGIWVP